MYQEHNDLILNNLDNWSFESAVYWWDKLSVVNFSKIPDYCRYLADIGYLNKVIILIDKIKSNPILRDKMYNSEAFLVCKNLNNFHIRINNEIKVGETYFNKLYYFCMSDDLDNIYSLIKNYRKGNIHANNSSEENMIINFAINKLVDNHYIDVDIIRDLIVHISVARNMNLQRKKFMLSKLVRYAIETSSIGKELFNLKHEYCVHIRIIPLIYTLSSGDRGAYILLDEVHAAISKYNNLNFKENFKPKIAVCISGMFKTDLSTLDTIHEKIVKPLDADVFIHSWDRQQAWAGDARKYSFWSRVFGISNSIIPKQLLNLNFLEKHYPNIYACLISSSFIDLDRRRIEEKIDSKSFMVENEDAFIKKFSINKSFETRGTFNQIKMFYGLYKTFELLTEYEITNNIKYDYVIRLRADTVVNSNSITQDNLSKLGDDMLAVHAGSGWGISDGFFYGTRVAYSRVVSIWEKMLESKQLSPFSDFPGYDAHKLLGLWLIKNNIKPIPYKLSCGTLIAGSNFKVPNLKLALKKDINDQIRDNYPEETEWLLSFLEDKAD